MIYKGFTLKAAAAAAITARTTMKPTLTSLSTVLQIYTAILHLFGATLIVSAGQKQNLEILDERLVNSQLKYKQHIHVYLNHRDR